MLCVVQCNKNVKIATLSGYINSVVKKTLSEKLLDVSQMNYYTTLSYSESANSRFCF